jgi:hypothetical protein
MSASSAARWWAGRTAASGGNGVAGDSGPAVTRLHPPRFHYGVVPRRVWVATVATGLAQHCATGRQRSSSPKSKPQLVNAMRSVAQTLLYRRSRNLSTCTMQSLNVTYHTYEDTAQLRPHPAASGAKARARWTGDERCGGEGGRESSGEQGSGSGWMPTCKCDAVGIGGGRGAYENT